MDKSITLIVSAAVIMAIALVVMIISSSEIGILGSEAEDIRSQGCQFQVQNADSFSEVDRECCQQFPNECEELESPDTIPIPDPAMPF